jgi:hypothetical protein
VPAHFLLLAAVVALLGALFWALRGTPRAARPLPPLASLEELGPNHCRHFAQIQRALAPEDWEFVRRRASRAIQRRIRADRKRVARLYLRGLREDFSRLNRLARIVASLSPRVERRQEWERLELFCRFESLYLLVSLNLQMGGRAAGELRRLTDVVGSFASQMETATSALGVISAGPAGTPHRG